MLMTYSGEAQSSNQGSILIPAARYVFKNGETQQNVYVKRFYLDKYEVTWREFSRIHGHRLPGIFPRASSVGRMRPLSAAGKGRGYQLGKSGKLAALGVDGRRWPWGAFDPKVR